MASYTIIGGDTKEYGPISAEDINLWISEGRLNAESLARGDNDTAWRTLGSFPEFAAAFRSAPPTIAPPTPPIPHRTAPSAVNFLERDYELDLGGCVVQGWELVKNNMGVFLVGTLIYMLIKGGIEMVSNLPLIGFIFSIVSFVISGPLMGGVFYLFLRGVRGEPAEIGDIFFGFKRAFGQLFLAMLAQGIFIGLCLVPFIIVFAMKYMAMGIHFDPNSIQNDPAAAQQFVKSIFSLVVATSPVLLICAIPSIYLGTGWKFTLPLILDKDMDFWTAMKTSFKLVNRHWWQVFGLTLIIGLLNAGGFLACCIGLVFTVPVGFAAVMFAYETIFGTRKE